MSKKNSFKKITLCSLSALLAFSNIGKAEDVDKLLNLSFKDLGKINVTSVSRKEENSFEAAASIYVVTTEDIKRSGATSVPEALRMVPGLNVARIDSSKWAITARGFNEQFSNKLLVLIDGRTVYTPLFSGVYWDSQDMLMEDIERIEVIKGPGATLWGANAVNGIINIITKSAKKTQGKYVEVLAGDEEKISVGARVGGKIGDSSYYRIYTKFKDNDDSKSRISNSDAGDEWNQSRIGFNIETDLSANSKFKVTSDYYESKNDNLGFFITNVFTDPVTGTPIQYEEETKGGNIVASYSHNFSENSALDIQVYYDYIERNLIAFNQSRETFDFDMQHSLTLNDRHDLMWGVGYRFFKDDLEEKTVNDIKYLDYTPNSDNFNLFSGFIQDKIALVKDELYLTIGTKLEQNYYTDLEIQPNARLAWLLDKKRTLWGAVSRAARTPTRGERGLTLGVPPTQLQQAGNTGYDSEYLTAYEVGFRYQPSWRYSYDISAFYNDYDDLRTFEPMNPNIPTFITAYNNAHGESYGVELASRFSVTKDWNLYANLAVLNLDLHTNDGQAESVVPGLNLLEQVEQSTAKYTASIFSRMNLPYDLEFDNSLYYVSDVDNPAANSTIDDYIRFDTRLGWKPTDDVEVSLVGQNLFDSQHPEAGSPLLGLPSEIERSFYARLTYKF